MKKNKDLQSYKLHDAEYNSDLNNIENSNALIERYNKNNQFENAGFSLAINLTKNLPKTHIDIGSGTGWLLLKTCSFFEKVVGIEPSSKAIEIAKLLHSGQNNISYVNDDMCEALINMKIDEPVFITTAVVLNHIEDYYVSNFLSKVNSLPKNSVLFFDERYDKNMQWNMWHVRSKKWWINNLPNWQLIFLDIDIDGYASGIYGINLGSEFVLKQNINTTSSLFWGICGIYHPIKRALKKIIRLFFKIK